MNFNDIIAGIGMPRREQIQLRLDFEFAVDCNNAGEDSPLFTGVHLSGLFSENPPTDFERIGSGYSNDYSLLRRRGTDSHDSIVEVILGIRHLISRSKDAQCLCFKERLRFFLFGFTAGLACRCNEAFRFGLFLVPDMFANNVLFDYAGEGARHKVQIHTGGALV